MGAETRASVAKAKDELEATLNMDIDDLFNDERYATVFGEGICELRSHEENETLKVERPQIVIQDRLSKFKEMSENFSSVSTRGKFFEEAHKLSKTSMSVEMKIVDKGVIDLDIPKDHVKDTLRVKIEDKDYYIPAIKAGYLTKYQRQFSAAATSNLERIAELLEGAGKIIEAEETMIKLRSLAMDVVAGQVENPERKKCQRDILVYVLTELYLSSTATRIANHFVIRDLVDDEYTAGAFVRLDEAEQTPEDRYHSMIQENAVGFVDKAMYSLNFRQLKGLVDYIFSKDVGKRLKGKVDLLSSVPDSVRHDLIHSPEQVLLISIREYFMTREEVMHLLFRDEGDKRVDRCVACESIVSINGLAVTHPPCPVMKWLNKHFNFSLGATGGSAARYGYIKPGIAAIARKLAAAQQEIKQRAYIGKDEKEVVAYTLDRSGLPKKIGSAGVRWQYPTIPPGGHGHTSFKR